MSGDTNENNNNNKENDKLIETNKETEIPSNIPAEMTTKEAYFASLNAWVTQANIAQNAMAMFPWYLFSMYPQMFQNQIQAQSTLQAQVSARFASAAAAAAAVGTTPTSTTTTLPQIIPNAANQQAGVAGANINAEFNEFRILDERAQADIINRFGGYEYIIAPFWKRAIAELIDMIVLLVLKILIIFAFVNIFDIDLGFDFDRNIFRKAIDDEDYFGFFSVSLDFVAFSSDLVILEMVTKVFVCFYEAMWTVFYSGATPGKAIMKIRILYVEAVLPLPDIQAQQAQQLLLQINVNRSPLRALVYPGATPSFGRAFMRVFSKNLIMTLVFPMCIVMIFFKLNRTAYDILTKTIVVENNHNPIMRRVQQNQQQ